jgi:hypothetical protein
MMKSHHLILTISLIAILSTAGCVNEHHTDQASTSNESDTISLSGEVVPYEEYANGIQVVKGSYVNGQKEGLWTYRYPSGHMKAEGNYKNGLKEGMWVEWFNDGDIMWKGEWEKGERHLQNPDSDAEILFLGKREKIRSLKRNSVYHLQIRVPNMPAEYLFVEADNGSISQDSVLDHFTCIPTEGSSIKIVVGYYPDTSFRDFRNLVGEYEFKIK